MKAPIRLFQCLISSGLLIVSAAASAQWTLNNEASTLSFVTVKADHVAEFIPLMNFREPSRRMALCQLKLRWPV